MSNKQTRQLLLRIDQWGFGLGGMIAATAGMLAPWPPSQVVLYVVATVLLVCSISARRDAKRIEVDAS